MPIVPTELVLGKAVAEVRGRRDPPAALLASQLQGRGRRVCREGVTEGTGPCPLPVTGAGCDTGRMGDVLLAPGGRPAWAERMRSERAARGWSQSDAVRALQAHAHMSLPAPGSLLRNWKRWEAGEVEPDDFYKPLIAKTFGTVTAAFFPHQGTGRDTALLARR